MKKIVVKGASGTLYRINCDTDVLSLPVRPGLFFVMTMPDALNARPEMLGIGDAPHSLMHDLAKDPDLPQMRALGANFYGYLDLPAPLARKRILNDILDAARADQALAS